MITLSDVKVSLYSIDSYGKETLVAETMSDEKGIFLFHDRQNYGKYRLKATKNGHEPYISDEIIEIETGNVIKKLGMSYVDNDLDRLYQDVFLKEDKNLNTISVNTNKNDATIRLFYNSIYLPHIDYKGNFKGSMDFHVTDNTYFVVASAPGCKPYTETVTIDGKSIKAIDVEFEPAGEGNQVVYMSRAPLR